MPQYEIRRIITHRELSLGKKNRTEYLVSWYGFEEPTWEPLKSVKGQPCYYRYHETLRPEAALRAQEPQFVVEKICGHRTDVDGTRRYLVKWRGYKTHENTWEPIESFEDPSIVENYERRT